LLRVAVHVTFAHRAVPLVLDALGTVRRMVKVRDAHSDEIIAMLLDGVADLGFVLPGTRPPPLRFVPLPPDPVIAVCSRRHPLAGRSVVPLGALAGQRLALNRWGTAAEDFLERLVAAGYPAGAWTECSDGITAVRLARHHAHVALVTASIAAEELAAGTLVRLPLRPAPRWNVPLALAYRARDRNDPAVSAVEAAVARLRGTGKGPRLPRTGKG
jgi:DNA-binding transcriptional LysR family regulator